MAQTFDEQRFTLNFRDFEALTTRPADCANASRGDNYWIRKHNHLDIARDNIAHVRRLVCHLYDNDIVDNKDDLQLTMRRIHGPVAGGSCGSIIGNIDPKLESQNFQSAMRIVHEQSAVRKSGLAVNDLKRQEREHKAREVFAEVVRFYHGAIILLFSAASAGIINLSSKCGNSKCADQLEIRKTKKVTDEGSERWALGIAVKDARIGFPEERSMVSSKRKVAYPCLYDIVMGRRYHVAYAPFFHYFAHLWHPACRAFRGKGGLLDDMNELGSLPEDVSVEGFAVDDNEEMMFTW